MHIHHLNYGCMCPVSGVLFNGFSHLVPLTGHTHGHAGIAIQTGNGWLLNAGDAYFYREEIGRPKRQCTPGLRLYQWMMETDREARLANQERLRQLSVEKKAGLRIFCSHDAREFDHFRSRAGTADASLLAA